MVQVTISVSGEVEIEITPVWPPTEADARRRQRLAARIGEAQILLDLHVAERLAAAITDAAAKRRAELAALAQIGGGNG